MEQPIEIRNHISRELAEGKSSQELIDSLQLTFTLDEEQALSILRLFYDKWQDLLTRSKIVTQDYLNWHVYMRHKALQIAITNEQTGNVLSILDSLAKLQKVAEMADEREIPIKIILQPKEETNGKPTEEQP